MRLKRPTSTNRTLLLLALGLFLGPTWAWAQATSFQISLNPSASTYQVNQAGVTLQVAAKNGGVTDVSFSDVVTIGLYANSSIGSPSPQLTDAQAIYTNLAGTVTLGVGTVSPTFTNGAVTMKVIFKTGNDAEAVLVQDASVTIGNNIGPFAVIGYTTRLFAKTLSGGVTFQPYPPNADILTTDSSGVSNVVDQGVTIPFSSNGATAAILTIGGFSGSYSYGNQPIQTNLWAKKVSGIPASKVSYQVILDYAGAVTDYNNFDPSLYPTYVSSDSVVGGSYSLLPAPSLQTGSVSLSTTAGFTSGQIILRVWDESSSSVTCLLRLKAAAATIASGVTFASNITVPYSNLNAIVMADLTPKTVLSASAVTMIYTLRNQSSLQIGTTRFNIPANPGGTGTPWTLASTPTTRGGVVVTYLNPSGSTPGYVNINWLSSPVMANEQVPVTMIFNPSSDVDQTGWDFGLITVKDVTNNAVNSDSSGALNITTLGTPDTPGSFTAAPANFTSSGGAVDLSWSQSVSQSPLGYIINRSGGGFTPVTITPSTSTNYTDSTAVNLTAYTYSIVAYNSVTQSGSAGAGPVTPFANPSTVTSLTALTGGTTIRLNWTAASAGSYPVAGYQIWRDTQASMATAVSLNSVGNVTTFDDTTVSGGTHYYYKLATRDNQYAGAAPGGQHLSGLSSAQGTGFPLGNPPTALGVSLISATPSLALSWTAPSSSQMLSGPATGYQITISPDGVGSNFVTVGPASYNDAAVTAGHFYVYNVRALDGAGILSNPVGPVTGYVGPGTPSGLTSTSYASAITLSWPKVANSAGETVMSYVIQRVNGGTTAVFSTSVTAPATIPYGDGTAVLGTDYTYRVAAVDQSSVTGGFSNTVTAAVLPNAPTGLAYVFNTAADNVTLTWATPVPQETNLTSYIRYKTVNGGAPAGTALGAGIYTYNEAFIPADAGSTITYFLQAGNISGYSPSSNTVGFQVPPNAPTGLGANSSNSAITLAWSANPGSEKVSKYTIYRGSVSPPSSLVSIGFVNSPTATYTDSSGLSPGVDYLYSITATNPGGGGYLGGEGLRSVTITSGLGPTTPTGLNDFILNTNNDLAVTWTSVTIANANATGVSLLANTTNNAGTAVTTSLAASAVSQFFGAQAPDTTYYYWLQTKNPYGVSSLAGPVSQLTYPAAVSLMPVTLANDGISRILNWTTLPSDVTQYKVYRQLQGTGNWVNTQTFSAGSLTLPVTLTSPVQPGKDYDYKIVAVNPTGNGPDSNIRSFSTLPSGPVSVTAVSGVSNATVQVDLTWADPNALAEGVTAFTVYRSTSNSSVGSYSPIATGIPVTTLSYSDSPLTGTTVYYYLIAADDSAGVETFLSTANAVSVTAYASPNPPTAPSATAVNGSVTLNWGTVSATTYPVSIYQVTKLANGVTVTGLTPTAPPFADTGLTNGVTYVYYFQTQDNQGHVSTAVGPVTGIPLSTPGAPVSLSVGVGDQELQLTWQAGTPGTLPPGGFAIFSATNLGGPYSPLTVLGPTATGLVDGVPPASPLSNGVTYYYYMQAFDNSGVTTGLHISAPSTIVSGVPQSSFVNPPSNLTATAGVAQITLDWTDSVTLTAPGAVTAYSIYEAVNGGAFVSVGSQLPTGSTETVVRSGLTNGSTYSYYLVGISSSSTSSNSATVFGIPAAPPAAPTPLVGVDGVDKAVLTWGASPAQGSITISQYAITRAVLPGAPGLLTTVSGAVTTYTDNTPANNGQTVIYTVAAINSNGTLGASSLPVTDYPYADFPPVITAHSAGTTDVAINFTPFASPSFGVTQFNFVRTPFSGGTAVTVAATGTSSPVTDTSATAGTLYTYKLQAVDDKGHLSALSNAVTEGPSVPPAAPATLLVTAGSRQVLIDWPASAPVSGSIPVSFYIVTVNGTPVTTTNTWFLDDNFGSFYTDPSGVTISIQAVDQSGVTTGNHASSVVGPVTVTTAATDLNPPTGLTATALSTTSVRLTWTAPNDMGYPVTAYSIYRASSFLPSGGSLVTTIANPAVSPVTTFIDTNLTAASNYYYVVRAVYSQSATVAGPVESPNSNHTVISTITPPAGVPPVTQGVMAFDANLIQPLKGETLGIYFVAPNSGPAELDVYNISGNPIRALFANAVADTQSYVNWDGKDRNGNMVASGIYLIEVRGPGIHQVKKVLVVK